MQITTRYSIGQPVLYNNEECLVVKIILYIDSRGDITERYMIDEKHKISFMCSHDVDVSHLSPVETDMDINYDELVFAVMQSQKRYAS